MIDISYCKKVGCGSNPENCGYYPRDCLIVSLRRSLESLIYICESYEVADGAPDEVLKDIKKANEIIKLAEDAK